MQKQFTVAHFSVVIKFLKESRVKPISKLILAHFYLLTFIFLSVCTVVFSQDIESIGTRNIIPNQASKSFIFPPWKTSFRETSYFQNAKPFPNLRHGYLAYKAEFCGKLGELSFNFLNGSLLGVRFDYAERGNANDASNFFGLAVKVLENRYGKPNSLNINDKSFQGIYKYCGIANWNFYKDDTNINLALKIYPDQKGRKHNFDAMLLSISFSPSLKNNSIGSSSVDIFSELIQIHTSLGGTTTPEILNARNAIEDLPFIIVPEIDLDQGMFTVRGFKWGAKTKTIINPTMKRMLFGPTESWSEEVSIFGLFGEVSYSFFKDKLYSVSYYLNLPGDNLDKQRRDFSPAFLQKESELRELLEEKYGPQYGGRAEYISTDSFAEQPIIIGYWRVNNTEITLDKTLSTVFGTQMFSIKYSDMVVEPLAVSENMKAGNKAIEQNRQNAK